MPAKPHEDVRTALLRAVIDLSDHEAEVTLAWLHNDGPARVDDLLAGMLRTLSGEKDVPILKPEDTTRDDAIAAIAAALDLLIQSPR